MSEPAPDRPLGAIAVEADAASEPFWEGLRTGRLLVPECANGHRFFPPMPGCPICGTPEVDLARASGRGRVYSWATVHIALAPEFARDAPYTVVAVDLEEGGRLMGRLLEPRTRLLPGVDVVLQTYEVGDQVLPGFRCAVESETATTGGTDGDE